MNTVRLNKTDSRFFKQNIVAWDIRDALDTEAIVLQEKKIIETFHPAMITAFLPVDEIATIGHFSACNYQFVECRLLVEKELGDEQSTCNLYPYEFTEVVTRKQLAELIKACRDMTFDDRFFNDPEVDNELALRRNIYFLEQSYKRKYEFIYLLQNCVSKKLLGFRSFKINSKNEASMLITGTIKEKQQENIQELINLFELEQLAEKDIRFVNAVISVQNFDEINRYIAKYAYTILDSKILFRKILRHLS